MSDNYVTMGRSGENSASIRVKVMDNGDGTYSIASDPSVLQRLSAIEAALLAIVSALDRQKFDGDAMKVKLL